MPLTRDPQERFANYDLFSIRFPMFDGAKQVNCTVSSEALQDLAASDGRQAEPIEELFKIYRSEIETIASRKYDGQHLVGAEVRVVNSDV